MPLSVTLHCVALNLPGHTAGLATLATPFAAGLNPEVKARCGCTLPGVAALFPWEQGVAMGMSQGCKFKARRAIFL